MPAGRLSNSCAEPDFQTWSNSSDDAAVQAVALGIKDNDTRHMHTAELSYLASTTLDDPSWAPIISLNAAYTYYPTYAEVLTGYNKSTLMPVFLVEANYEFEHNSADQGTPYILRLQEYWTMLSGATGQLYGNYYTVRFPSGWQSNLDTTGARQLGYVKALFEPRRWYDLVPDQNHTLLTSGYGTFASSGALGSNDYATAAITADGALGMVYMPSSRNVTVAMSRFSGPVTARWYDPASGSFTTIPGSPLANSGPHQFTPPGSNSDGDSDWVLVLEAQ